jgi:hypothetical protein
MAKMQQARTGANGSSGELLQGKSVEYCWLLCDWPATPLPIPSIEEVQLASS